MQTFLPAITFPPSAPKELRARSSSVLFRAAFPDTPSCAVQFLHVSVTPYLTLAGAAMPYLGALLSVGGEGPGRQLSLPALPSRPTGHLQDGFLRDEDAGGRVDPRKENRENLPPNGHKQRR